MAYPGQVLQNPASGEEALVRVEVRPALRMERLFEAAVALAEQMVLAPLAWIARRRRTESLGAVSA